MSNRRPLIAANWKMHAPPAGFDAPHSPYRPAGEADVFVFPTFLHIAACKAAGLSTGGQWGHPEPTGAFTGDVSMAMLREAGCLAVLCGHSERRARHGESSEFVALQAVAAKEAGLHPIVCVGETGEQREAGKAEEVVAAQVKAVPIAVTWAYEPVWAIGTGKTATPEDAQRMHAFIRGLLPADQREKSRILYGGSAKPENAAQLLGQPDIDGLLVGGASLDPDAFGGIIAAASRLL